MTLRDGMTPEAVVLRYYGALEAGDMDALRGVMAAESYIMTLEAYGLKHTFADPAFKALLRRCGEDVSARKEVEAVIAAALRRDAKAMTLDAFRTEALGAGRCAVRYTENGFAKKMALRETEAGWKIDYYAGRKRP